MSVEARQSPAIALATPFELKNATLTLNALVLRTTDPELLSHALAERFGETPLFDHDPVVLDLSGLPADAPPIDFEALIALLRAIACWRPAWRAAARAHALALEAGLGETVTRRMASRSPATTATTTQSSASKQPTPSSESSQGEPPASTADRPAPTLRPSRQSRRSRKRVTADRDERTPRAAARRAPRRRHLPSRQRHACRRS